MGWRRCVEIVRAWLARQERHAAAVVSSAHDARDRSARLVGLLADRRAAQSARSASSCAIAAGSSRELRSLDVTPNPSSSTLVRLSIDDAGEYLVALGARHAFGHLRSSEADLALLADVESLHARLELVEDFHAGPRWRCTPERTARVSIGGRAIPPAGATLAHGDVVELGANAAFRFVARDAGSASAVLELLGGLECRGATRILLLASGAGGRVRIGARRDRHVSVADLVHDVRIELDERGERLALTSPGGLGTERASEATCHELALPLARSCTVVTRARLAPRPPFALVLAPLERSGPRA